jgi:hypothetical protein
VSVKMPAILDAKKALDRLNLVQFLNKKNLKTVITKVNECFNK